MTTKSVLEPFVFGLCDQMFFNRHRHIDDDDERTNMTSDNLHTILFKMGAGNIDTVVFWLIYGLYG